MLPLVPVPLVISIITWIVLFKLTRYVSVGSIAAAIVIPIATIVVSAIQKNWNIPVLIYTIVLCVLAVWKHRTNISRLIDGTESRFEKRSKAG